MSSSNRHWPSMFKSKPTHHQWQHDVINPSLVPNGSCHRPQYTTTTTQQQGSKIKGLRSRSRGGTLGRSRFGFWKRSLTPGW
ncbi:hypothetical protein M0R45_013340 [Rubus argutus]|uniref:Uncharacterized protein n=1 Tax=Rubus argutus TaxID=59490 RepID=A0AAW1XJK3_RUBAR